MTTQEHIRSEQVLEAQSTGLNIFLHITLALISLTGIGLIVSIPVWIIAAIVKDKSQKSDVPLAAERALTRFIGDKPKYMATVSVRRAPPGIFELGW